MRFKVLHFLSEQARLPLPKRLQIVLLNLDRHLIFLKVNHRVAQNFNSRHRGSVTGAVANSCHSSIAAWEVFKSRSDLILKLGDRLLGKKGLLQVLGALVVILFGFVNESLDERSQLFSLLRRCFNAFVENKVG